ncbi:hypothetical protein VTI74DRAFT_7330 [Chaetomium olivicolor]
MRQHGIVVAILQLAAVGSAQEYKFFKWNTPRATLERRQSPPPGYHPEFGSCGSGTTCENACGPNWLSCQASTELSLFCYNKVDLNQTCCENGSGRACDKGYYCAWQEFGGKVWCCENDQSLEECGVPVSSSSVTTSSPTSSATSGGPNLSSTTTGSDTLRSTTGTATNSGSLSTTNSQCPTSTVTSWATTTVASTVTFAAVTVTVTEHDGGCFSSRSSSQCGHESTTTTGTITEPPSPSSTSHRPTFHNTTTTKTLATAGARTLSTSSFVIGLLLLPLLLI